MVSKDVVKSNLNNCLQDTEFPGMGGKRKGKVRDTYDCGENLLIVTTDRLSAFDRNIALIPFKGEVLNWTSAFWFDATRDIVSNHMISIPDPNAMFVKKCKVLPIEFVVRGYLTGSTETSAWTLYSRGDRSICGNLLPDGMKKNQKFEHPIITPTTKSEIHDEPISEQEIIERKILNKETWDTVSRIAFQLFDRGSNIAKQHGLILVDTKYEFGIDSSNKITLIDEVHTPDSSRYWLADSYKSRFDTGLEPENIDKEFIRLWFKNNCDPYNDAVLPQAPADLIVELSMRYMKLYMMITGNELNPETDITIQDRLKQNLRNAGIC